MIGVAATPVGRFQAPRDAPLQTLEHEIMAAVALDAIAAAGVERGQIGATVYALEREYVRQRYFCTYMANHLRLPQDGIVMETVGNGMTAALAFDKACDEIRLGRAEVALAMGLNIESAVPTAEHVETTMRHVGDVEFQTPFGLSPIAWYAMDAARYMHEHGATRAQLAAVAVKNRRHAGLNPRAHFRAPLTLEEVLAAPPIVEPLGLYDVPPRSDGAVCVVLARADAARRSGRPYAAVRGRGFFHEGVHQISELPNDMLAFEAATRALGAACADAALAASDLDFAEIYAPCTITEVLASEAFGFCARGQGAAAAASGETALGGRIPINTSGGCLSRGHPPFATSLYSVVEAFEQLAGGAGARQVRGARLGMTASELGNYNAALVHIFEAGG